MSLLMGLTFWVDKSYSGFMLARVFSGATVGLESVPIEVEVDIASQGLPSFTMVGTQCQNLKS